ncbi:MAG: glycosyltransferase [Armatimonadota bacterium]|jgi:glycosyltransferase involved in cell wall biosynthesis
MKASIIIPAYNAERTIANTLRACLDQDFPADEYEIIVVDDGSKDDTAEQVRRFPVRLLSQENAGAAAARNRGAGVARGDVLLFVDADCINPPDAVRRLVGSVRCNGGPQIVSAIYAATPDLPLVTSCLNEEIRFRHLHLSDSPGHVGSYCMAMPRRVFEDLGGFDERFKRSEDNEFCTEAVERGYELHVLQDVALAHHHVRTMRAWLRDQYTSAYWKLQSLRTHSKTRVSDGYFGLRDWMAPALAALMLGLLPFVWLWPVHWIGLGLLVAAISLHLPATLFAVRDTGDWRHMVLVPMQVARSFAWVFGAVAGLLRPPALDVRPTGHVAGER